MKLTNAAVAALIILLEITFIAAADEGTDYPFWSGSHIDTIMDSQHVRGRLRNPQGIYVTDTRIYILADADSYRPRAIRVFDRSTQMELGDESFALAKGNRYPVDITSDGTTMWVNDYSHYKLNSTIDYKTRFDTGKVYAYNIATKERDISKEFRVSPASRPQYDEQIAGDLMGGISIATDGATIWVRTSKKREPPKTVFHTAKPSGEILAAFNAATLTRDTTKDIAIEFGDGYVFQGSIETDGETIWVAKGEGQWYENLEAYNIATDTRDASKDFDGFPDFSKGDAGLLGPLSVTSMSLFCSTLYVLNHSRKEVYVIGHSNNSPNCNALPTRPSLDTSWILRYGYEYDYP